MDQIEQLVERISNLEARIDRLEGRVNTISDVVQLLTPLLGPTGGVPEQKQKAPRIRNSRTKK